MTTALEGGEGSASRVARLALHYFDTLSDNGTILGRGGVTEHKTCVLILSTNFVLILRGTE